MTTIDLDHPSSSTGLDQSFEALAEENQVLRDYLKRVLKVLETRVDERDQAAAVMRPTELVDHPLPVYLHLSESPMSLAEVQRGLRRLEENIERLTWLVSRNEEPVILLGD